MMTTKEAVLKIFRDQGKADAQALRSSASSLDGTALISQEKAIPDWDKDKDYSSWPVGSAVRDEGQVWTLIQPHNASYYEGRPSSLRALWGLAHTKNPSDAKEWVAPYGTSGMYMKDEVYKDAEGKVWKCLFDNTVYTAAEYSAAWEEVEL